MGADFWRWHGFPGDHGGFSQRGDVQLGPVCHRRDNRQMRRGVQMLCLAENNRKLIKTNGQPDLSCSPFLFCCAMKVWWNEFLVKQCPIAISWYNLDTSILSILPLFVHLSPEKVTIWVTISFGYGLVGSIHRHPHHPFCWQEDETIIQSAPLEVNPPLIYALFSWMCWVCAYPEFTLCCLTRHQNRCASAPWGRRLAPAAVCAGNAGVSAPVGSIGA